MPGIPNRETGGVLTDFFSKTSLDKKDGQWVPYPGGCNKFHLPYTDETEEGLWLDQNTGQPIEFTEWTQGQPNGRETENCALVNLKIKQADRMWYDGPCSQPGCTLCSRPSQPILRLRGLCKESKLTNVFTPVNKGYRGNLGYMGLHTTNIEYNDTTFLWVASKTNDPAVWTWATSTASKGSGLLGTFQWTVYNDSRECNPNFSYMVTLTLTGCSKTQFTCTDGSCVEMDERCNGRVDCEDKSDESGCRIANILSTYSKGITPAPLPGNSKAKVTLSVQLQSILMLDELAEIMYVKYVLVTKWSDPGLDFDNLKKNIDQNVLSQGEKAGIWIPKVVFENTKATLTSVLDEDSIIRIVPNQNFTHARTNLQNPQNIYMFKGINTKVEMSRSYDTEFLCSYNMGWYPFDSQTCTLDYVLDATASVFVSLEMDSLTYTGPVELTQYFVRQSVMRMYTTGDRQGVRLFVVLGRRLLSNILTVYVPTVLLNIIGHITVYFKPFFFEAIITVNLTVMLVLTTM